MRTRDAHQHVQRVLTTVDPSVELTRTAGRFVDQARNNSRLTGPVPEWCLERIRRLTGLTSFTAAARNPDVRTLMAFGYLGVSERPASRPVEVDPSMPLPPVLEALEPDFFEVLLKDVNGHQKVSPSFRARMTAAKRDVTDAASRLARMAQSPASRRPSRARTARAAAPSAGEQAAGYLFGILCVWLVVRWIRGDDKD